LTVVGEAMQSSEWPMTERERDREREREKVYLPYHNITTQIQMQ